ncbi:YciI family protein [Oleiagrimonas soli]|nr:YciI family protein [Oleiagrimonas soli]KGI77730.1 dehydrogenase [Oleiagrimonas soli]
MRVMVMVKATADSEAGRMPRRELFEAMDKFNEELVEAGVVRAAEGLKPSSCGVRVAFSGDKRSVIDGPFAETKELVAGFWLWEVGSMQEAIDWVRRCPPPHEADGEIEIRPLYEMEDFGEAISPDMAEREERLRARMESGR